MTPEDREGYIRNRKFSRLAQIATLAAMLGHLVAGCAPEKASASRPTETKNAPDTSLPSAVMHTTPDAVAEPTVTVPEWQITPSTEEPQPAATKTEAEIPASCKLDSAAFLAENGAKFPADQISVISKPLSEWTAEEKQIGNGETTVYQEVSNVLQSDWVKKNNLELISVSIGKDCGYSALYKITTGNYAGHLVWATDTEGRPLSQPDGLGLGKDIQVIPEVQTKGEAVVLVASDRNLLWINSSGDILYVYDALRNQWVQKVALLHGYQDAEQEPFTGNFSEKYPVEGITVNLTAEITEGLSIPISYKLDLGFTDIKFKQEYVNALGKQFLYRCYKQNGDTSITFEEFIKQVKEDKVRIQQVLFDERTGAKVIGWFNPKQGYSFAISYKDLNLPYALVKNPMDASKTVYSYYATKNDAGKYIEIYKATPEFELQFVINAGKRYKTNDIKTQFELYLESTAYSLLAGYISSEIQFMSERLGQTEQSYCFNTEIFEPIESDNDANKNEWITITNFDPSWLEEK
jgi:hypothetical protein